MNIDFIEIIRKKSPLHLDGLGKWAYKFDNKYTYKGTIKSLKRMDIVHNPPSFELLWSFNVFIKYLEVVHLYHGDVYSNNVKEPQNGFTIEKKNEYKISFTLDPDDKSIRIVINRDRGSIIKTIMNVDPEFKIDNDIDAELFLVLEKLLVNTMINVLEYSYKYYNN